MQKDYYDQQSLNQPMAEINVVPYVDVMLVLLIIFMVTAPLLTQGVTVELPQSDAETLDPSDVPPIVVTVDGIGNYFLNIHETPTTPLLPSEVAERVNSELVEMPARPVLVRGDDAVNYGKVITAMVLLQHAGADSVGLVTESDMDALTGDS